MPVIENWQQRLSAEDLDDWPGFKGKGRVREKFLALLPALVDEIDASGLLSPRLTYETHRIAAIGGDWIKLRDGTEITGVAVAACQLENASQLVTAVGTIGEGLENRVSEWFADKRRMKALALTEIGIASLFRFSRDVVGQIAKDAKSRGLETGPPLQPGNNGLDLDHQPVVSGLAGAASIGVRVTQKGMMTPVNSLSMIFGLGKVKVSRQAPDCDTCKARGRCRYRAYEPAMAAS